MAHVEEPLSTNLILKYTHIVGNGRIVYPNCDLQIESEVDLGDVEIHHSGP